MNDKLILMAVASDGSVDQWDGLKTTQGILLRWFQGSLGFPQYGYDLFRAKIQDFFGLDWAKLSVDMASRNEFKLADGLLITSPAQFTFGSYQGRIGLQITSANPVTFIFPDPAWYLAIQIAPIYGDQISVKLYFGDKLCEEVNLTPGNFHAKWRTRGFDKVILSGKGICTGFNYQRIASIKGWQLVHHACLPVSDPAYAGGSNWTGSDEDEAHRRLPLKADWSGRYFQAFQELYPYLQGLATERPLPSLPPGTSIGVEAPKLALSAQDAIEIAMLNPHVARMLGIAWDDPLNGQLDGDSYAYKLVGVWKGQLHRWLLNYPNVHGLLKKYGIWITPPKEHSFDRRGWSLVLASQEVLEIFIKSPCEYLSLRIYTKDRISWQTLDERGHEVDKGVFVPLAKLRALEVSGKRVASLQLLGPAELRVTFLAVQDLPVERVALLPCVEAKDPGPPTGPQSMQVEVVQSGNNFRATEAHLSWPVEVTPSGAVRENGALFFQPAGMQAVDDPDQPAPPMPSFKPTWFFSRDELLMVSPQAATSTHPCFYIDNHLQEGWRCWWVRGIDIFGRASSLSAPNMMQIVDNAIPPAPSLLLAEYVQDGFANLTGNLSGYSHFGRTWLESNVGGHGVVVSWGWSPELAEDWPDVDAFQVFVRRPLPNSFRKPEDPVASYSDDPSSWGPVRAEFAPVLTRLPDQVKETYPGIPSVLIWHLKQIDEEHAVYQTDIALDLGRGTLLGGILKTADSGAAGMIVGHGEGETISITVEHYGSSAPGNGAYQLVPGDRIPVIHIQCTGAIDKLHSTYMANTPGSSQKALLGGILKTLTGDAVGRIVRYSEGADISLTLEHGENQSPSDGPYELVPSGSPFFTLQTSLDVESLDGDPYHLRICGVLTTNSSSTLSVDELVDLPSLANKLRTQVNLISTYLYGQLSAATLTTLADYQGVGSVPLSLQQALIEDFNAIICGQSLYDAQRFIGIALRSDTQQLLAQNPQEDSLRRLLNRLLLEDAYPQEIARNHNARWAVLYQRQGTFLCAGVNPPMPGDPITWIPAYLVVIPDNDFGPDLTGTGEPVAYAQVAVRAVRRFKKHPLLSDYSKPGTISGVDCREPEPPTMEEIPSGPFCAQLASRADWYGISRFSLNWDTKPGETYRVYRALNEAVFALDRNTYSTKAHPFPSDPEGVWPNELYQAIIADSQRKSIVQSDFTMLENALSGGNGEEIRNSYRNLHADTQRLIAGQAAAESAYSLRHGNPLTPHQVPFVDEFDGRPRCHWFYRVTALSSAGVESRKTAPTPPICAPDVVPPSQPQVLMALAHEQGIRLRWLPLCEPDLAFYIIYRAADGAAALDVRTMIEVARVAKNPDATPSAGEKLPSWVTKATNGPVTEKVEVEIPRKLEYCDPAPAGREWFYRIVAEDSSGNRSAASAILKGRALRVPPAPPVWRTPQRMPDPHPTKVLLSWSVAPVPEPDPVDPTHTVLKDPRLTCMVERYGGGIDRWVPVSRWLPRGIYTFQDIPPDLSAEWSYRLRVRDHFNQNAPDLPQVTLPEVSPV